MIRLVIAASLALLSLAQNIDIKQDDNNLVFTPAGAGTVDAKGPLYLDGEAVDSTLALREASVSNLTNSRLVNSALLDRLSAALDAVEPAAAPVYAPAACPHCSSFASCAGSGACQCRAGFRGSGRVCRPIDLCADGTHHCVAGVSTCRYMGPGEFRCDCNLPYYHAANGTCTQVRLQTQLPASLSPAAATNSLVSLLANNVDPGNQFGRSMANLGDVDGDGVDDLAVGSSEAQAVWIVFMHPNSTRKFDARVSQTAAGASGLSVAFGASVAALGDWNKDGVPDMAVGAPSTDGSSDGRVVLIFLLPDGGVLETHSLNVTSINPAYASLWGSSIALIGDLTGDGLPELCIGAPGASSNRGILSVLSVSRTGTLLAIVGYPVLTGLSAGDHLGWAVAHAGDVNSDGIPDLFITAPGRNGYGAAYLCLMDRNAFLFSAFKYSATEVGLSNPTARFGQSLIVTDINSDGINDIVVGAPGEELVYAITLTADHRVDSYSSVSSALEDALFGSSLAMVQHNTQLAVGMPYLNASGVHTGGVEVLGLTPTGDADVVRIVGASSYPFEADGKMGTAMTSVGDADGNGVNDVVVLHGSGSTVKVSLLSMLRDGQIGAGRVLTESIVALSSLCTLGDHTFDIVVGAPASRTGGSVYTMTVPLDASASSLTLLMSAESLIETGDEFGAAVASLGDVDGDGKADLVVGMPGRDAQRGTAAIIFSSGPAKLLVGRSGTTAEFFVAQGDRLGLALAGLGDINGDGVPDLAIASKHRLFVVFFSTSGIALAEYIITPLELSDSAYLTIAPHLSLAGLGDVDGNGVPDMALAVPATNTVMVLSLSRSGAVNARVSAVLTNSLYGDSVGASLARQSVDDATSAFYAGTPLAASGQGGFLLFKM